MKISVGDIQHRFNIDGHLFVITVCAPGRQPAPIAVGEFHTHLTVVAPDSVIGPDTKSIPRVAEAIASDARRLLPTNVPSDQWGEFRLRLLGWVDAHRKAAHHEG